MAVQIIQDYVLIIFNCYIGSGFSVTGKQTVLGAVHSGML